MSVDFESIAARSRCEVSSLKLASPLLEQGLAPPFLARYRRDELSGIDEGSLWQLSSALQTEAEISARRDQLHKMWEATALKDPALESAIRKAASQRMLGRMARRLKSESDSPSDAVRLAARVLSPSRADSETLDELAKSIEGISDAAVAVSELDAALATRLGNDPRIISAAVRWLTRFARIQVGRVSDPHLDRDDGVETEATPASQGTVEESIPVDSPVADPPIADQSGVDSSIEESALAEMTSEDPLASEDPAGEAAMAAIEDAQADVAETADGAGESITADGSAEVAAVSDTPEIPSFAVELSGEATSGAPGKKKQDKPAPAKAGADPKKTKKVSPRQRRRRWLVSVLKGLAGKQFDAEKMSSFQVVMLARALRSQVAECSFQYDATKLVAELQNTAGQLNRVQSDRLRDIVLKNEAAIREAAELAWWDDLQERASARLVGVTADQLRNQINRGGVEASVVLAIDAVGPQTAASTIVAADGRVLHSEDIPCSLGKGARTQAVARIGELIHTHHVNLIVISNGPARRTMMVALAELVAQSPPNSIRWTLAERSGADAYAGSDTAGVEMRSTPRRFRAAAWLAFSVLHPAQALAKVDPLKLRLNAFQKELSETALASAMEDIMISGASRGGVDVNGTPATWMSRLPGMTVERANAIDAARKTRLFASRQELLESGLFDDSMASRQSLPFLRVFGSIQTLDGTMIHPDDYTLAGRLATAIGIELPPSAPPGYVPPDQKQATSAEAVADLKQLEFAPTPAPVEDFAVPREAPDFVVEPETDAPAVASTAVTEQAIESTSDVVVVAVETAATDEAAGTSNEADEAASVVASAQPEVAASVGSAVRRPLPEKSKVDKCVKEWQIGPRRAHQIVHWLCDPFGDSDPTSTSSAVMDSMPTLTSLKPGDQVVGIVVGLMPFGVFIELAPDCSGLVHISKLSDSFVEDLHEAVGVGDIVTAYVTGIDEKRRRVALSLLSPQREAELESERSQRQSQRSFGGRSGGGRPRPQNAGYQGGGNQNARNQRDGNQAVGNQAVGNQGGGNQAGGNQRVGNQGDGNRNAGNQGATRPDAGPRPPRTGNNQGGGTPRGGQGDSNQNAGSRAGGGQGQRGQAERGQARSDRGDGGQTQRQGSQRQGSQGQGSQGQDTRGQGSQGQARFGGGARGGQRRDNDRGSRSGARKPESYRVESKAEAKPLTEAMQKGAEPLRSFGDLAQFLGKGTDAAKPVIATAKPDAAKPDAARPKPVSKPDGDSIVNQPNLAAADESIAADSPVVAPSPPTHQASDGQGPLG
jgi:protein Tex